MWGRRTRSVRPRRVRGRAGPCDDCVPRVKRYFRARRMRLPVAFASLAAFVAVALGSGVARADLQHVVARGHTIEAIAHRYHVTPESIITANHLKDPRH